MVKFKMAMLGCGLVNYRCFRRLDMRPISISGSASATHISVSSHRGVTLAEPCYLF